MTYNYPPYAYSAVTGDTAVVQALLAADAHVNAKGAHDETALHMAAKKGTGFLSLLTCHTVAVAWVSGPKILPLY